MKIFRKLLNFIDPTPISYRMADIGKWSAEDLIKELRKGTSAMSNSVEYRMEVTRSVIEPREPSAYNGYKSSVRRVRYVAHAYCEGKDMVKIMDAENRPLYEVVDEGLRELLGIVIRKGTPAVVTIKSNVSLAEGAKVALLNKYASEMEFAAIKFD